MSFLFGGNKSNPTGAVDSNKLVAAEFEIEMVTDLFNRLVDSCHTKCITNKYPDGPLNSGESLCIDRCVAKYFEVNGKVSEKMQQLGATMQPR